MTDLQIRMTKTVPGQVTWADPELGSKCIACKNCERHPRPKLNPRLDHVCTLVKAHTGKIGQPFNANLAIACPKFSM